MTMKACRNYNANTSALSKNLEKLSSGYKINRAGDAAAGLAISEKMRAQITGLNAAQKNVKDGISLVKTAGSLGSAALAAITGALDGSSKYTFTLTAGDNILGTQGNKDKVNVLSTEGGIEVKDKTPGLDGASPPPGGQQVTAGYAWKPGTIKAGDVIQIGGKYNIEVMDDAEFDKNAAENRNAGKIKKSEITNADARNKALEPATEELEEPDEPAKGGKALTLQIGDTSEKYNQLEVNIGDMHVKAMGFELDENGNITSNGKSIQDIDISSLEGAQEAISTIKNAINYGSSIRDTDVAKEMMACTKNNILIQSAQAMPDQANAVPQGVLQLLG